MVMFSYKSSRSYNGLVSFLVDFSTTLWSIFRRLFIDFFIDLFRLLFVTFSSTFFDLFRLLFRHLFVDFFLLLSSTVSANFLRRLFRLLRSRFLVDFFCRAVWSSFGPVFCQLRDVFGLFQPVLGKFSGQFWGQFVVCLEPIFCHFWVAFVSVLGQFVVSLGSFLASSVSILVTLSSFSCRSYVSCHISAILCQSGTVLDEPCVSLLWVLCYFSASFWSVSCSVLVSFWFGLVQFPFYFQSVRF